MKKLTLALTCLLTMLVAAPAFAQDADITAATKELKAYHKASAKGDINGSMRFMTDAYRAETQELLDETQGLRELGVVLLKKSSYEIVSVTKEGEDIIAAVKMTTPDMDMLFAKAVEGLDPNADEAEFMNLLMQNGLKLAQEETFPNVTEDMKVKMVKENGKWKIDDEY